MDFKLWLEALSWDDINHWANYAISRKFSTEQEARDWIFYKKERSDQEFGHIFPPKGPEFNRQFANEMPIYQSGKSFKIGKRIRTDNRLRLSHLEVRRPDIEELNEIAQANGEADYKFHPVKWIPISYTVADNDYYLSSPGELRRIQNLAAQIKENKWIEAVVYDYRSKSIIEGQHRARAMKVLGFATVPGIGIEYDE